VVITLPAALEGLSYLSCTHAYPSFVSTLAALETLAISVRSGGTEKRPPLDRLLAKAPNLKTLLLSRTPDLVVESSIEHSSLTSIKAHMSAFRPLQGALLEGRLSPPISARWSSTISAERVPLKWEGCSSGGLDRADRKSPACVRQSRCVVRRARWGAQDVCTVPVIGVAVDRPRRSS
jgi:hypothetical protein